MVGSADQLTVLGGDAVEGAVAEPDGAVSLVAGFVAAGGQRLADRGKGLARVAVGRGPAGRLGAELGTQGGGGAVEGGLGSPGAVGLDGVGEEFGQAGVVAGGQAELELAVGADIVLGRAAGARPAAAAAPVVAGLQQAVVDELVEVVRGQGPADAGGVGSLVPADGDTAVGHVSVEGSADGVTQAGQAGELLIDVVRAHRFILKQKILDSYLGCFYNKYKLVIERKPKATKEHPMTKLQQLYDEQGQSPWLDNLTRVYLRDGTLGRLVADGIRGVTANPTIFARAIEGSDAYDEQFAALIAQGRPVLDAYWDLVVDDIGDALGVLRPTFDSSAGTDGFVSIEVAPELARDTDATIAAARQLHQRIAQPNLFVKIPATGEGVPAIQAMIAEGRSINITLIFSLARYAEVIDAYLAGLETLAEGGGDLASVHSVASFFVSRVDTEVDRRLDAIGTGDALALQGQAAVAQAKLAYRLFRDRFAGERWERLAARGAQVQRPLWASTSTKNPSYPDTLYVDSLIGPDTVNTLPEATIAAFEDHGTIARTIDSGVDHAGAVMDRLAEVGVDMDDVGRTLEDQGVASFHQSFAHVLQALEHKARQLAPR